MNTVKAGTWFPRNIKNGRLISLDESRVQSELWVDPGRESGGEVMCGHLEVHGAIPATDTG